MFPKRSDQRRSLGHLRMRVNHLAHESLEEPLVVPGLECKVFVKFGWGWLEARFESVHLPGFDFGPPFFSHIYDQSGRDMEVSVTFQY